MRLRSYAACEFVHGSVLWKVRLFLWVTLVGRGDTVSSCHLMLLTLTVLLTLMYWV